MIYGVPASMYKAQNQVIFHIYDSAEILFTTPTLLNVSKDNDWSLSALVSKFTPPHHGLDWT